MLLNRFTVGTQALQPTVILGHSQMCCLLHKSQWSRCEKRKKRQIKLRQRQVYTYISPFHPLLKQCSAHHDILFGHAVNTTHHLLRGNSIFI